MSGLQPGYVIPRHLLGLIDGYSDAHGRVPDASIARAIHVKPQTISSWRTRGIKRTPSIDTLRRLAEFIGQDYETVVLRSVLVDIGWVEADPPAASPPPATTPTDESQAG